MNQSHSTSRPGPSFVIGNEELENWEPEFLDKFFRKRSLISLGAKWNKRKLLVGSGIPPPCPHAHAPTLHPSPALQLHYPPTHPLNRHWSLFPQARFVQGSPITVQHFSALNNKLKIDNEKDNNRDHYIRLLCY